MLRDDPISESVSLRVDGTAAVRRGGGRGKDCVTLAIHAAGDNYRRRVGC